MQCTIFAHRGITSKYIKENSCASLINASDHGFEAIECDVHYWNDDLVLMHDAPQNDTQKIDNLENFLTIFHDEMQYWLDFKNLDNNNVDQAIKNLKEIVTKLKFNQNKIYFAPFITKIDDGKIIYQTIRKYFGDEAQIIAVKDKLLPEEYQNYYSELKNNNIFGLSIEFQNINSEFMKIFSEIKIFAWTVNDSKDMKYLEEAGVHAIATDNSHFQNEQ